MSLGACILLVAVLAGAIGLARVSRRARRRRAPPLSDDLARLARAAPGGRPADALEVPSTSVVEDRAVSFPCHVCGESAMQALDHQVEEIGGERLRRVRVGCDRCGAERQLYVRVMAAA